MLSTSNCTCTLYCVYSVTNVFISLCMQLLDGVLGVIDPEMKRGAPSIEEVSIIITWWTPC